MALPEIRTETATTIDAAREQEVLAVFRQLLSAPALGVEDNFFSAGGSSLLAARVAARLRSAGVLDVATSAVFAAPSARALTRYAAQLGRVAGPAESPAAPATGSEQDYTVQGRTAPNRTAQDRSGQNRGAQQREAFRRLRPQPGETR